MGVVSILKPNFLGLLKFLNSINVLIVFLSLINLSQCIYEDQIGKFDWRQTYVGRVKFAQFDTSSAAKRIIVATEENVLAALNMKTGAIMWRHVFGNGASSTIEMLALTAVSKQDAADYAFVVVGSNPYIVRGYDVDDGVLTWEWNMVLKDDANADFSEFFVNDGLLVHLMPVFGSHLEVTKYSLEGTPVGGSSRLPAAWVNKGCILAAPYYVCVSGARGSQTLIAVDVTSDAVQVIDTPLANLFLTIEGILRPFDGATAIPGFIMDDSTVVLIANGQFKPLPVKMLDRGASVTVADTPDGKVLMQAWNSNMGLSISAHLASTGEALPQLSSAGAPGGAGGEVAEVCAVSCARAVQGALACRMLLSDADDSARLVLHTGRVIWSREEALANVVAVEFVDLPISELEAAIETEFDQKEGSIWAAFTRRLHTQLQQLKALSLGELKAEGDTLQRDYFNLHKLLVIVTDVGKIFGMDSLSGAILWSRYEPELNTERVAVFTRRSARHPPHSACVTVVGAHHDTGNGYIISLDPIRGTLVGERALHLDVPLSHSALLHKADEEKLHALLLLDASENVLVFPLSSAHLVEDVFMYVANQKTAQVQGYALVYDGKTVQAQKTWQLNLGGDPDSGHRIVVALGKPANEKVHSPGKVLGDRSVLYKYTNPNLVLFVTEGPDPVHSSVVVSWCVDAVSGLVVAAQAHRRARALPLAVHSDHALAYLYHSDKNRRIEIATLELYEGGERWLGAGAAFSSFEALPPAAAERAAFIVPALPTAAAVTRTERGLADKHVLVALASGAIIEIPWAFLDPRRPIAPTPEQREEGLVPYAPELPLPSEAVINYNLTLHRIRAIYTAPSGLESTSLVLATGLDLFYTRVAPSKTFDLLKDDFDYHLIILVLSALLISTYVSKYFASRKMLKLAWK